MKRLLGAIAVFALSAQAFAATSGGSINNTSSSDLGSFYESLKESPLGFGLYQSYSMDNLLQEKSDDGKDLIESSSATTIGLLSYKMNDDYKVTLENRIYYSRKTGEANSTDWGRAVLRLTRSNILDETRDGVGMSADLDLRAVPKTARRRSGGHDTLVRAKVKLTKKVGDVSLSNNTYYAAKQRNSYSKAGTGEDYWLNISEQSISLTDKMGLTFGQEAFVSNPVGLGGLNEDGNKIYKTYTLDTYLELTYSFTSSFMGALTANVQPLKGHDNDSGLTDGFMKNPTLGMYIYATLF